MNKEEYITKEYFDKTLDKKLDHKFELWSKDIKQHMTDLKTGFREDVRIVCDQVSALGEKIDRVDQKITNLETKVSNMDIRLIEVQDDVILIKDVLPEKADKKRVLSPW